MHLIFTADEVRFSGVKILVRNNSPGSLKGARKGFRLGSHDQIFILPHHRVSTTGLEKTRAGGGSVSWDFMCPSERSAPPGIRTRLPVEEK